MSQTTPHDAADAAHGAHGHEPVRQEKDTTALHFLLWTAIGIAISTVICIYLSLWLLSSTESEIKPATQPQAAAPGLYIPAGQPGILERGMLVERRGQKVDGEAQHLKREQEAQLQTFGWVDRPHNLIRIPIDQAMNQVVTAYGQRK